MDFLVCRHSCCQTLQTGSRSVWSAGHCQLVPVHDPLVECLPEKAGSLAGVAWSLQAHMGVAGHFPVLLIVLQ